MTNLEYCNEILSIIGNVKEANDAIYNLAFDAYLKLGGQESQQSLATIYNELKNAIQIWDNTDSLNITENGTYNLLGKIITVNVQCSGSIPNDEIWYTSSDGNIVTLNDTSALPIIVSNTYSDGKGVIKFQTFVTSIGERAFFNRNTLVSIMFPNRATIIGENAIGFCKALTSVTISNRATSIEGWAFQACEKLNSITIPNSVTSIGNYVFRGCTGLTSISYTGTMSQWNAITKGSGWHNDVPATVVHCSDGDTPI